MKLIPNTELSLRRYLISNSIDSSHTRNTAYYNMYRPIETDLLIISTIRQLNLILNPRMIQK